MESQRLGLLILFNVVGHAFSLPANNWVLRRGYVNNGLTPLEADVLSAVAPLNNIPDWDKSDFVIPGAIRRYEVPAAQLYMNEGPQVDTVKVTTVDTSSSTEPPAPSKVTFTSSVEDQDDEDDDDDDLDSFETMNTSSAGTSGSSIFSLLNLANALFPSSGGNVLLRRMMREVVRNFLAGGFDVSPIGFKRRIDIGHKLNELDTVLKPPTFERQEKDESEEEDSSNDTEEDSSNDTEESGDDADESGSENKGSEESLDIDENGSNSDEDYDEPPEGDGQGGGILGLLAGLSGGEDGSDLGSLLAAVGGIVANLSGDGVDINALIASGLGLFVGLLSEGEENPGAVLASYLLTSLDTLSGGGAKNNGAFFGTFLNKLIKGTSAAASTSGARGILPPILALKGDIFKAILKFGTSLLGLASSSSG